MKNRYINTKFWSDSFIVDELNPLDRYLFLYLLSNEKTSMAGIYELPVRTMANETGLEKDELERMLKRLEPKVYCFDGWVYIKNFVDYQAVNPNIEKSIVASLKELPVPIRDKVHSLGIDSERLSKAFKGFGLFKYKSKLNKKLNKKKIVHQKVVIIPKQKLVIDDADPLKDIMANFIEYRKGSGKKPTDYAIKLIRNKLDRWYPNDIESQRKCLEQTIENSWSGIFQLKNEPTKERKSKYGIKY